MSLRLTQLDAVIEIPRGGFVKRGWSERIDFISPFPCPFNYGSIPDYVGCDGDLLDAVVLGGRLPRGRTVSVKVRGAIGFTDRGMYDDKLICSRKPINFWQRHCVLTFFYFYAMCKRILNLYRGRSGATCCNGWVNPADAFARARHRKDVEWSGPVIPF